MKTAIPQQAKITKEAKGFMQECVSEFISFITSEAVKVCRREKRKTLNGEGLLFAMDSLGFENYAEAPKISSEVSRRNYGESKRGHSGRLAHGTDNERVLWVRSENVVVGPKTSGRYDGQGFCATANGVECYIPPTSRRHPDGGADGNFRRRG
jgi:histone H3/H4